MKPYLSIFIFTLLFLLAITCEIPAQNITFKPFAPPGESPMGLITGMTQDTRGYMWFAGIGLYRYDGYSLKSYVNDPSNPNSLGSNQLESICADKNGIIWIGTQGYGLDRFDPATGIFTHYRHNSNDPSSIIHNKVTVLTLDHEGILWIGTHGGLERMDTGTGRFFHYRRNINDPNSLSCDQVRSIYEDKQGTIWVGTGSSFQNDHSGPNDGGLNRMDKNKGTFKRYMHDPKDPHSLINNKVCGMLEDSRGVFWVGTAGDGLHTMDRSTGIFERHLYDPAHPDKLSRPPLPSPALYDQIRFIKEDAVGYVWIGTILAGMNRYDPVTGKVRYIEGTKTSSGLNDNSSWDAFTSQDGVFWVSTLNPSTLDWGGNLYYNDPTQKNIPYTNIGSDISVFLEEDSTVIWIGTNQGLIRTDQKTGVTRNYTNDLLDKTSISDSYIISIIKDRRGIIWIGTVNGLNRYNKNSNDFTRFIHNDNNAGSLVAGFIYDITLDNKGFLWLATSDGVDKMDPTTNRFTHYKSNPEDTTSLSGQGSFQIHNDLSGNIWIGFVKGGGINRFEPNTGTFKHYLLGSTISCLFEDSDSTLWAGTDGGFFWYNKSENAFALFADPEKNIKVESISINRIEEDNKKNLWISSSAGILKLNAARNKIHIYGSSHGVNAINLHYSSYKAFNGKLFFGANLGYYSFFPDSISSNSKPPQLILANLKIGDETIKAGPNSPLKVPLEEATEILLNHTQNIFSIDFAGIHFTSPENNKHIFILENYDHTWRQSGSEHTAYYYNIPPGHYTFRVKAASSNGVWAEKSIDVIITPPWWRTWWAYCIYGMLFIALIYSFDRFQKERIIKVEREKTRERELAQSKEIEKAYTELKSTQAQLIQSEKMASHGELTAGIAHEIQNPLNFVNNFSEINVELIDELKGELAICNMQHPPQVAIGRAIEIANDIRENEIKISQHGKRADGIVKGMLQHSQKSKGVKELTNINTLAEEYLRLAYHTYKSKHKDLPSGAVAQAGFNCDLKLELDSDLPMVNVIPQDIGRVLLNLFNNAFWAVGERSKTEGVLAHGIPSGKTPPVFLPTVTLTTKKLSDHQVEIRISDNGPGIPDPIKDKIFQPFFTTKPTGQGTGLGLSLAYDIVKAHGGTISVNSTELDGTVFIIQIPIG